MELTVGSNSEADCYTHELGMFVFVFLLHALRTQHAILAHAPVVAASWGRPHAACGMRHATAQELHLYLDYKSDESYTPSKVSIRAGTAMHDLQVG